jgi:hypothetical protein
VYDHAEVTTMERRTGPRGRTDFSVVASSGLGAENLRAVALSSSGLVVRRRRFQPADSGWIRTLELDLPERARRVFVRARLVRSFGPYEAFRFVEIDDVDRLNIAEHLDVLSLRGSLVFEGNEGLAEGPFPWVAGHSPLAPAAEWGGVA